MNVDRKKLAIDIVHTASMMIREYARNVDTDASLKEKISMLFLARSIRQLQSIFGLVGHSFVSDGLVLLRPLLERYLLFRHLCQTDEFAVFDDWCFRENYEQLNRIKSINAFAGKPEMKGRRFTLDQQNRYKRVCADKQVTCWRRPDMEDVARKLEMKFLYDACYVWASGYVHPSTQEGDSDFWALMGKKNDEAQDEVDVLLRNAALVTILHMQHFMNEPEYNWRKELYDLIDGFAKVAGREQSDYVMQLDDVVRIHESGEGLLARAKAT
ncbi:MAG: hypothetical protein IPK83_00110 [Planctomycetes bacterium]|nr:hypothetical protein [Planctomycetota bacterium]